MGEDGRGRRARLLVLEQEMEVGGRVISGTAGLQGGHWPCLPLHWYLCLWGLPTVSGGRDEQNTEEVARDLRIYVLTGNVTSALPTRATHTGLGGRLGGSKEKSTCRRCRGSEPSEKYLFWPQASFRVADS